MAKTQSQIQNAQKMLKLVQDYITLATAEKKLKIATNVEQISKQLEEVTAELKEVAKDI